jgi:hypothetical protein
MTRSAPSFSGLYRIGVAKVLSTIASAPADFASDEIRAMSMMRRFGFAGVSK